MRWLANRDDLWIESARVWITPPPVLPVAPTTRIDGVEVMAGVFGECGRGSEEVDGVLS